MRKTMTQLKGQEQARKKRADNDGERNLVARGDGRDYSPTRHAGDDMRNEPHETKLRKCFV